MLILSPFNGKLKFKGYKSINQRRVMNGRKIDFSDNFIVVVEFYSTLVTVLDVKLSVRQIDI